ncbi:hypothetical protein BCR44DRAFT_37849 [Catenaria anguillulae PL171]|uniref:Ribosomal protein S6 n=1 Tax=Catenaria anguillulae PL171 TaxID=765915 RepID=A0A1Y2HZV8_9FUNG|nr:hypothetical protein BCR44DRAFT_37849 [Catenaria anguillulae PL171]
MPLYELVAISRKSDAITRPLLKQLALSVIHRGGVVRSLNNLRAGALPYRIKAHQEYHTEGQYFTMVFDAAPTEIPTLTRQLQLDSRVIRATVVKVGTTLEQTSGLPQSYLDAIGFPNQESQGQRLRRLGKVPEKPWKGTRHEWLAVAGVQPAKHVKHETVVPAAEESGEQVVAPASV